MMKFLKPLLIVFLVSSMLFTGCGGSDGAADADQPQSGQSEPAGNAVEGDADKVDTEGMGDLLSSAYVDMMKNNEYLMKYKFTMDYGGQSMEVEATLAKKGEDMAMTSNMTGAETTTIFKDSKMYMVDHSSKTVTVFPLTDESTAAANAGTIDMEGVTYLGNGKEDGLVYEEYSTAGSKVKYYFDGKDLVKMAVDVEGQTMVMEILEISKDVPESMFEIPAGYQEVSMDGE